MNAWKKNAIVCAVIASITAAIAAVLFWFVPMPDWNVLILQAPLLLGYAVALACVGVALFSLVEVVSSLRTWMRSDDSKGNGKEN